MDTGSRVDRESEVDREFGSDKGKAVNTGILGKEGFVFMRET